MKEIILNGFIYDFSIGYILIDVKDFLHIYDKLMKRTKYEVVFKFISSLSVAM